MHIHLFWTETADGAKSMWLFSAEDSHQFVTKQRLQ